MPRPTSNVDDVKAGKRKAERATRKEVETTLQAGGGIPTAPEWMTKTQQAYWNAITEHYKESNVLAPVDSIMLARTVVAAEFCDRTDAEVASGKAVMDRSTMAMYKDYFAILKQGCQEFGLSIQSRAKTGSLVWAAVKEQATHDTLDDILGG